MHSLRADLRYTFRELRRSPGFAATAILSLALGIAATSAVFSVIHAVLINPFPYPGSDRLMQLSLLDKNGRTRGIGFNVAQMDILRQAKSVESIVAEDGWNLTTTDGDLPEDVSASYISANAPNHWGVAPLMGRWLIPSDGPPGQEPERVVVLGYRFWQRYYTGDPNVVGRNIQLIRKNYKIVGVMPPRYRWREADIYVPLKVDPNPKAFYGTTIRIRPGYTKEQANAELQPILERFAKATPDAFPPSFRANLRSIIDLFARPIGPKLYLLFGAVASLLLIGCANVSILLLARGANRQHELAVRTALGAPRGRIIRQLFTESLVIASAGAALGILLAWRSLALLVEWVPSNSYPAEAVIEMNLPVLLFSASLAILTAMIFGLSPALQLSRPDVGRVMQSNTRRIIGSLSGKRAHGILVTAQVALTLLMLTVAGAAGKGFLRLVNTDLGYDPHYTMSLPIPVHENTYNTWKERAEYFEQIRSRVAAMPQVVSAGISTNATPPNNGWDNRIEIAGRNDAEKPTVRINFISPEYFPVLRIPLAEGRMWDRNETMRGAPVAVVNQSMARLFWPDGNVIGKQVRIPTLGDNPSQYQPAAAGAAAWLQIVGIVADVRNDGLRNAIKPALYVPYTLRMRMFTQILVRTKVPPLSVLNATRAEIVQIDREQQVMRVRDLEEWITGSQEYAQQRLVAMLFGIFSALALLLAGAGIYSVVSYGVAMRTNEFGIRIALGAGGRQVVRLALAGITVHVAIGLAAGLVASIVLDKAAAQWVTETAQDPLVLAGVTALLAAIAAIACLLPARRASGVDPMVALRYE